MCITKYQYCDVVVFRKCHPARIVIMHISVNEQFCSVLVEKCEKIMEQSCHEGTRYKPVGNIQHSPTTSQRLMTTTTGGPLDVFVVNQSMDA